MKQALVTRSRLATHVRNVQHGTSSRNKEEEEEEGRDHSSLPFFFNFFAFYGSFFSECGLFFPPPFVLSVSHVSPT